MADPISKRLTVTVGCKLPHGLVITLQKTRKDAPIGGGPNAGGEPVTTYFPVGEQITLNGTNSSNVIGGYGLTDVDAEFMREWMKQNADFPPVMNGLIFYQDKADKAADQAREMSDVQNGMEPLNPSKPAPGIVPEPV